MPASATYSIVTLDPTTAPEPKTTLDPIPCLDPGPGVDPAATPDPGSGLDSGPPLGSGVALGPWPTPGLPLLFAHDVTRLFGTASHRSAPSGQRRR